MTARVPDITFVSTNLKGMLCSLVRSRKMFPEPLANSSLALLVDGADVHASPGCLVHTPRLRRNWVGRWRSLAVPKKKARGHSGGNLERMW